MGSIRTISEQVYCKIKDDIISMRCKPGEKMTLKSLEEQMGVSSTPIREALTHLQRDGLIEYQPNVGMSVISYTKKDVEDIFRLMEELDVIALHFACKSPKRNELIQMLSNVQDQAAQLLADNNLEQWEELSDKFHLVFYDFADNSRLTIAADRIRMQLTVFSYSYQQSANNQVSIQREHDMVLKYVKAGNDSDAEAALRQHLQSSALRALTILPL